MENVLEQSQIYPWQQPVWDTLTRRFPDIGHGLLFYGKSGCGKEAFSRHFLALGYFARISKLKDRVGNVVVVSG